VSIEKDWCGEGSGSACVPRVQFPPPAGTLFGETNTTRETRQTLGAAAICENFLSVFALSENGKKARQ
jgi:hypothetical protein